jgi:uncharacterized membrane protein YeaQ/YmgE (transglycosylase-associated protein family)
LGGWLASVLFHYSDMVNGINVGSIVVAFIGAVILLIILRLVSGKR